jgi:hypothetical protein
VSARTAARAALLGGAAGAVWGVAARVWMRLVSTQPEFSWAGTLFIVGLAALLGAGVGVSWSLRAGHGRRRVVRVLPLLPGLLLFAGQGLPFLTGFLGGALLWHRRPALRVLGALGVVGPAVAVWWMERFDETTFLSAPQRQQVALLVGMPLLSLALAVGGHLVLGPAAVRQRPQSASPERARSSLRSDSSLDAPAGPA